MDVTLERVQFKFASIIGELCSKPLILSQFAVWVDLRLSEYKLKGAISLDCSGDKPDPDWLKGIKDDIQMHHERLSASLNESVPGNQPSSRPSRLDDFTISSGHGDLEPDPGDIQNSSQGVMIKQELDPDPQEVYALELHPHHDIPGYRERKRGHSSSREDHEFSPSPFKVRKSSDISDSHKESNQSLMSIIGSEGEDILSVEEAQNNIDIAMAAHAQESIKHMGNNSSTHLRSPHPSSTASKSLFSQDAVIPSSSSFSPAAATKPDFFKEGRISPETARKFSMVELVEESGVYLKQGMLRNALNLCSSPCRLSKQTDLRLQDGRPAARFLLSAFFTSEQIARGKLRKENDEFDPDILDPHIIKTIIDFCIRNSASTRSSVKQALHRKISSYKFKHKQKSQSANESHFLNPYDEKESDVGIQLEPFP